MFRIKNGIWTMGIPAVLSLITVFKHSVVLLISVILIHFIILRVVPAFRGHESLWMFIFVSISTVPFNIYILIMMNEFGLLFGSIFILGILRSILYYAVVLSVEEIIMGVATRMIWKKQYKIKL